MVCARVPFEENSRVRPVSGSSRSIIFQNMAMVAISPLRTWPPRTAACLNVTQLTAYLQTE